MPSKSTSTLGNLLVSSQAVLDASDAREAALLLTATVFERQSVIWELDISPAYLPVSSKSWFHASRAPAPAGADVRERSQAARDMVVWSEVWKK